MAAHRYWRVLITAVQSGAYASCAECELRATAGGADQTGSGTPSASSEYSGSYTASKAFDNNNATLWSSGSASSWWLAYDFGAGNEVDIAEILWRIRGDAAANQGLKDFAIQYSDNGTDYTSTRAYAGEAAWALGEARTYSARSLPPTPDLSITGKTTTTVNLAGTAFSQAQGATHAASQWQVQESGGDWSAAVFDSGDDATNLVAITVSDLEGAVLYDARVRYKDSFGNYSAWSTTLAVSLDGFATRVSAVGRYIIHGVNKRRVSLVGRYIITPEVDVPPAAPGAPILSLVADSATQITVTFATPGNYADTHELWWGTDPDSLELYSDALTAVPDPVVFSGLEPITTYYFQAIAVNAGGETPGTVVSIATLAPALQVAFVTDTTAGLVLQYDPTAVRVQYQTALDAETDFSPTVDDAIETNEDGNNQFGHEVTGLTASTWYRARARSATTLGGAFGAWTPVVRFQTAAVPAMIPMGGFTAPKAGALSGVQTLEWDLSTANDSGHTWTPTLLTVSEDGLGWTPLATQPALPDGPIGSWEVNFADYPNANILSFGIKGRRSDNKEGLDVRSFFNNDGPDPMDHVVNDLDDACWLEHWSIGEGEYYRLNDPQLGELDHAIYAPNGGVSIWLPCLNDTSPTKKVRRVRAGFMGRVVAPGGISPWWMNQQVEGGGIGFDFYTADWKLAAQSYMTYGNVWPLYPCVNIENLAGRLLTGFTAPIDLELSGGVVVRGSNASIYGKAYYYGPCQVHGQDLLISTTLEQLSDGTWWITVSGLGNKPASIEDPSEDWFSRHYREIPINELGCGVKIFPTCYGAYYNADFHSGGMGIAFFSKVEYWEDQPCEPPTQSEPPGPVILSAVQVDCTNALLTVWEEHGIVLDSVRFRIAAADDPSFAAPILDTGWDTPIYNEPEFGQVPAAYHLQENMDPGSYLAIIEAQLGSTSYESDPIPFTILGLAVDWWGGWDNRQVEA